MSESEYLKKAMEDKFIKIDKDKNRISYKTREGIKSYPLNKPEEQVRAEFYSELIYKYKYEPKRIGLEVEVPRRKPTDWADIVVYEDDDGKKPYIVVECKRDGISEAEIKQAIEQVFGNANSLRSKYAIVVAGSVRIAFDIANYPPSERENNIISDIPIRYGKVPKYTFKKGAPEIVFGVGDRELRKPTRQELLNKFQQCHDIIWEGGRRNPAEAFDEMSKLMFCKIWDERWITKKGEYYRFQIGTHETKKEIASRVKEIYKKAQMLEPGVFEESIKVSDAIIYSVVQILQEISLSRADLDAKGEAFEHFLGKIFKGEMGQYFTPRELVRFMVSFLEPTEFDYVIDPACGSGGFLLEVLEQIREKLNKELDIEDAKDRWKNFALDQVWGIEINSQLARVAMMNMILHEDGHTNIENGDALDEPETWAKEGIRKNFGKKFNLLITNPPFGAEVKWEEKQYLARYKLGKKKKRQKTEILFIERAIEFLKPGGRMGIVLPDGILTNSTLQYVRDFIMERAQILGIISLPPGAFTYYGAGVKASLVFLRKKKEGENLPENYPIFMAEVKHIGYDTTGRPDKNEFPEILKAWKKFKEYYLNDNFSPKREFEENRNFFHDAPLAFAVGRGEIEGRIDTNYYKPEYREVHKKLKESPFEIVTLKSILSKVRGKEDISGGATPKITEDFYTDENKGIKFLRIQNIGEGEIILNDLKYIKKHVHYNMLGRSRLRPNDVLLTITGRVGYSVVIPEDFGEANINQHIVRMHFIDRVNPYYISWFLNTNIGRMLSLRNTTGMTRIALDYEAIKNLEIPLPPREIQDKIAKIMHKTLKKKKELEKKADKLLESIDDYILSKLGIILPEFNEKSPLIFGVGAGLLKGKRWDTGYYRPDYRESVKAIQSTNFERKYLKEVARVNPKRKIGVSEDSVVPYVGLPETDEKTLEIKKVRLRPYKEVKGRNVIKIGDILFARIEPSIYNKKYIFVDRLNGYKYAFTSTEFHVIEPQDAKINPLYLFWYLRSKAGYNQIFGKITGTTGRRRLEKYELERFIIIVPPRTIQNEIAQQANSLLEEAKQLRSKAKQILEEAKQRIENIILGEESI